MGTYKKGIDVKMIIGIPTNTASGDIPQHKQNAAYINYVLAAGFVPVLLPIGADVEKISDIIDGLLLPGGIDIDPIYYGISNYTSYNANPIKDAFERDLMYACIKKSIPIFGICRGMQLIGLEYIKWLEKDTVFNGMLSYKYHIGSHNQKDLDIDRKFPTHYVGAFRNSLYSKYIENEAVTNIPVNSMHHQCLTLAYNMYKPDILKTNKSAKANQKSQDKQELVMFSPDRFYGNFELLSHSFRGIPAQSVAGQTKLAEYQAKWCIVEAFRILNAGTKIMGVQWHPEELMDTDLIKNFFS